MQSAEPCRLLEWDSTFWSLRIARVTDDVLTAEGCVAVDQWAVAHAVDCMYLLARADHPQTVRLAQDAGFRLVDVRVEFARALSDLVSTTQSHVREYRESDLPVLRGIARKSHEITRFYVDPGFARERCAEFYEVWIERSCAGWADRVLVATLDDHPVGYLTGHLGSPSADASLGLVGVSDDVRGKGLGEELVRAALSWFRDRGVRQTCVVTQGVNIPAQRLFQRCGFRTRSVGLWFHKWYQW